MVKHVISIVQALKCAANEKNRQARQFKQKQNEIYNEGITEVKLQEQLMQILDEMYQDPSVSTVTIEVAKSGLPYLSDILPRLHCVVIPCAEPTKFILLKDETYI